MKLNGCNVSVLPDEGGVINVELPLVAMSTSGNSDRVRNCYGFCCWDHISDCRMLLMWLDGCESRVRVGTQMRE